MYASEEEISSVFSYLNQIWLHIAKLNIIYAYK